MVDRAKDLIYRHFINPFLGKGESCVGVEIEMPVVNLDKKPVKREFLQAMVDLLVNKFGFEPVEFTLEGFPIRAVNDNGDVFSFETSFNTIEFSMGKKRSITAIADCFYQYLRALKKLEEQHQHLICGLGINPFPEYADSKPLNTPSMTAKSEFLKKFTNHHDGEIFHGFSASTQTHLDIGLCFLPRQLNLLGELAFIDAILFSNSLPFHPEQTDWKKNLLLSLKSEMERHTFCFRDTLWRLCEAPNIAAFDGKYHSIEDVVNHLLELKIFIVSDGRGGFKPVEPVKFRDYFADKDRPEEDILFFRSLEPIAVSKHGTIEIRHTCTQPLKKIFAPVAFYTGITENHLKALELSDGFRKENKIATANSILRDQAVHGETIVPRKKMNNYIMSLLATAREGLVNRNFGEEKFFEGLESTFEGVDFIECPAQRQISLHKKGMTYEEIIIAYSSI